MGRIAIKIKDKYFIWSTVVDAPVTTSIGELDFPLVCKTFNCKTMWIGSVNELIAGNRAGKQECELSSTEIYEQYA